jgi:polyisoprenoid-binding protein YceI
MKQILPLLFFFITACRTAPKADNAFVSEAETVLSLSGTSYVADTSASVIEWIGTKPTGYHHGTLKLSAGELILSDNAVQGGRFKIDIASLRPDDQKANKNAMLQRHLLSDDFFDAAQFPEAEFVIAKITPSKKTVYTVTGNLKMKSITKSISFPATIAINRSGLTADAQFNFDRTLWGLNYGNDKSLGNWFIRPDVNIKLHLVAKRL